MRSIILKRALFDKNSPNALAFGKADWPPEPLRGARRRLSHKNGQATFGFLGASPRMLILFQLAMAKVTQLSFQVQGRICPIP